MFFIYLAMLADVYVRMVLCICLAYTFVLNVTKLTDN